MNAHAEARKAAIAEFHRQLSTEGRCWFRDRECVGPIDYQGVDTAEIVRVAVDAAIEHAAQVADKHNAGIGGAIRALKNS